jgi:hypothetical protein
MLDKYKDNEIVKSLLDAGLDEEYILKGIENGEIVVDDIEKAGKTYKADEADEEKKEDVKVDETTETDEEENEEELEKACLAKKAELSDIEAKLSKIKSGKKPETAIEKSENAEDKIEKSMDDIEKSFGEKLDLIEKSIKESFETTLSSIKEENELLKSEIESLRADVDKIGNETPEFKAPTNLSFIEKGMAEFKDTEGKAIYHITKQREQIKDVMLKAYDSSEGEIKKSIADELSAYSSDTQATSIDEKVAKYLYDKENIRLVK